MTRNLRILLAVLVSLVAFAQAQDERALFNRGLDAFRTGNVLQAQEIFLNLLRTYPDGRLATGTRLMLAKSYYRLDDFTRTEYVAKNFFTKHADSDYLDDMHHVLGKAYFRDGKFTEAIVEWRWVVVSGNDPRLAAVSRDYIYKTMIHFLSGRQIETLLRNYPEPAFAGIATVALAGKLIQSGDTARARDLLSTMLQEQPDHPLAGEARRLLGDGGPVAASGSGILFFKPGNGDTRILGDELEMGMSFALQEYRSRNPRSDLALETVPLDPGMISTLTTARSAIEGRDPLCLVGPIGTDQAAGISLLAGYEKRPHIVPLSSETGLTDLSDYTFQINPDARTKGRFLGRYTAADRGANTIAIMAPVTPYGESFVQSFIEEAQANDAKIVAQQWYYEDAQDFTRQFRAIWREGIYLAFEDSVMAANPEIDEAGLKEAYQLFLEETFEPLRRGTRIDSTEVPATGIDALVLVIPSPDFIEFMAPQLAFNNIRTELLGNEGWNDPEQLRKYRTYLEGMEYIAAGYLDPNAANTRLFTNRFRTAMKVTPTLFHTLGYDVMKWMLSHYESGITPEAFRDRLARTELFRGLLEGIEFSSDAPRVNNRLTVLKMTRGQIIRLN